MGASLQEALFAIKRQRNIKSAEEKISPALSLYKISCAANFAAQDKNKSRRLFKIRKFAKPIIGTQQFGKDALSYLFALFAVYLYAHTGKGGFRFAQRFVCVAVVVL